VPSAYSGPKIQKNATERQLREKSDKIAGLVTGGDSFCYFQIGSLNSATNVGMLMAISSGKYPLYEVAARIVDLQKMEAKKGQPITLQNGFTDDINVDVGSMAAGVAAMKGTFPLGEGGRHDYNIFFSARNGLYTQLLRVRKVDRKWLQATAVQRSEGNETRTIFEQIPPEFPADAIDWKQNK
jgi:hypothetical protein